MKNIKLHQAEYMEMGPLNRDSGLKHAAQEVRKGAIIFFFFWFVGWLDETRNKKWSTLNEFEMLEWPWYTVSES